MFKTIARTLFASLVILGCTGEAQEAREEHIQVGSHPLSPEVQEMMEEARLAEALLEEETQNRLVGLIIPIKYQNETATAASCSPAMYHRIKELPDEYLLVLDDGSHWNFDASDATIVDAWKVGAPTVVSPKMHWPWSSNHAYVVTNRDTNESISVNLFIGPIEYGNDTLWVGAVDWANGHLLIQNALKKPTVWEVAPSDVYLLEEWSSEECLVIGENTSWLWLLSNYNHIIINVDMNHFIRARPIDPTHYVRAASTESDLSEDPSILED